MRSGVVRLVLFLLAVAAFAGAGYIVASVERDAASTRLKARRFDEAARGVERDVAELRAAQFACVAAGQGFAFWTERATAIADGVAAQLKQLQADAASAEAAGRIAAALQSLDSSREIARGVHTRLRNEQTLLASNIVFGELRQASDAVAARVAEARNAGRVTSDAALEVARRTQLATGGGAAAFAIFVLMLLTPNRLRRGTAGTEAGASATGSAGSTGVLSGLSLRGNASSTSAEESWPPASKALADPVASADLATAALLCTDFARLRETSELPALLERFARLIDAAGLVVWIGDSNANELRPAAAHGYPAHTLSRIRGISKDADNATACAYREAALQVVPAEAAGPGALAVPLMTPDGCVGVLSAEMHGDRERHPETQAVATIVAAQLATLVSPQTAAPDAG